MKEAYYIRLVSTTSRPEQTGYMIFQTAFGSGPFPHKFACQLWNTGIPSRYQNKNNPKFVALTSVGRICVCSYHNRGLKALH